MYNSTGWSISPKLEDDKVFMDEVDKLVNDAEERGQLSRSANDYRQEPETELFVNIVIRAYKTMVDPTKVGKDERRRVLMHPDIEVLQSNIPAFGDNCFITGDGIEVHPATPDSK